MKKYHPTWLLADMMSSKLWELEKWLRHKIKQLRGKLNG